MPLSFIDREAADPADYRVLILAPTARDARAIEALLGKAGVDCETCADAASLAAGMDRGVGTLVIADTLFDDPDATLFLQKCATQPDWSDIPIVLLCLPGQRSRLVRTFTQTVHNVTVLERPTTSPTLLSSVRTSLRARRRQYQLRDQLLLVRTRERQLQAIADNTPDVLSRFDRELRHVFINAAATRFTGRPPQAFLGRTCRQIDMPPALAQRWDDALRTVFASERTQTLEFDYDHDGARASFVSTLIPERDEHGAVTTVLCVTHDITERRNAEKELRAADRLKNEFLAMLAHELRNPLAPIRDAGELLGRALPDDQRVQFAAAIVRRQAKHMTRLVDDLLDVSRITEGRIELRPQTLDLSTLLDEAVESVAPAMRERQHTLLVGKGYDHWRVHVDHARFVQCIANVLANAAKYTDPGGRIQLEVRSQEGQAVITVSDNGIGISPDLLPRVFDLFVQGTRSLDRSQGGLGIGLSVVKRLIEMHGGTVTARSAGLGKGASFELRIPLVATGIAPIAAAARPKPLSKRILVVDDNCDAADSLASLLSLDGHSTIAVYSASDALQQVSAFDPEVVLLDIGLPDMDGYEVAKCIRRKAHPARLIALTGYGQAEDIRQAHDAGFDGHAVKPVELERLDRLIAGTQKG